MIIQARCERKNFTSSGITDSKYFKFLLIVIAANLKELPKHLPAHQDNRMINSIITKMCGVFDVEFDKLEGILREYQSYL